MNLLMLGAAIMKAKLISNCVTPDPYVRRAQVSIIMKLLCEKHTLDS
jgi:hypothetical protein